MNPTIGALAANSQKIVEFARAAVEQGAALVIFPELAICGYPPRDLVEKADFVAASRTWLWRASQAVPEATLLCGGLSAAQAATGKSVLNTAFLLRGGTILFEQSKMLLPTYDVFDELRYFAPAESQEVYEWQGRRLAVSICEDAWNDKNFWPERSARLLYPVDPVERLLGQGADWLINISASPFTAGKIGLRREMLAAIARSHRTPVLFVNQVGGNDQLVFDGSSLVLDAEGRVCAAAASFEEDLLVVDSADWAGPVRPSPRGEVEALYRALVLGTRDYVTKCGFKQVVIGLSGGIDSALTATIAVDALGAAAVMGVALPSRYSSPGSIADARQLAANLGIDFRVLPIEPALQGLETVLGAPEISAVCSESAADLSHQNLQARARGTLLMALSNQTGALVLSTGNKSELATGYCTLYGDMAGGLAVLSDVLKTQVYDLARFVNRDQERIPKASIEKAPSAELKPDQTDQDDLPPYADVDRVIHDYVEEYRSAEAIATSHGLPPELVAALIRRIDRSEYKRQQAAPGLKVSKKAFGVGRRFPVAQQYGSETPALEPVLHRRLSS